MLYVVLISVAILLVQLVSTTQVDSNVVRRDALLAAFYGSVNQRLNDFVGQQNISTTNKLTAGRYNDVLCTTQFLDVMNALNRTELWALTVIDAWGKLPSGILYGNLYELGNFDECLGIDYKENDTTFVGQYCLAQVKVMFPEQTSRKQPIVIPSKPDVMNFKGLDTSRMMTPSLGSTSIGLNVGVCVPDSCSAEMVQFIVGQLLESLNISDANSVSVTPQLCTMQQGATQYRTIDIIAISFFSGVALIMLLSTIYDVWSSYFVQKRPSALLVFSMFTNGQKIFQCKKRQSDDVMYCLNGIRVLSIVWVIFGHTYMFMAIGPLINTTYFLKWVENAYSMLLISAPVSVDSFFVLSGLLVTWSILRHLDSSSGKLNIFWLYLHRYIRLTPPLAAAILLCSSLIHLLDNGPLWNSFINAADKPCHHYWWSALLYLQNYINPGEICLGHSWYLSVDMQLYVLSPLLLYPLWRWPTKTIWAIPVLILGSMAGVFTLFLVHNFSIKLASNMMGGKRMELTYYPTHTRMGAWLVGVLLGFALHNFRGRRAHIPKVWVSLGWSLSLATLLGVIFGNYPLQQFEQTVTVLQSAFYETFSRITWALALSWVIFACIHGYGGPINWFLSLSGWQPLARISYSIYIVHLPVQLVLMASVKIPAYFSDLSAINHFWGQFGSTLIVAFFWTLAFESPVLALEKLLLTKTSKTNATISQEDLVRQNIESSNTNGK